MKARNGIAVDTNRLIFRLYSVNCLYAFRINEVGSVEHLYWGQKLSDDDDLRYLTKSNVLQPFDPQLEVANTSYYKKESLKKRIFEENILDNLIRMSEDEVITEWRKHRGALGPVSTRSEHADEHAVNSFLSRRLENISWRLHAMGYSDLGQKTASRTKQDARKTPRDGGNVPSILSRSAKSMVDLASLIDLEELEKEVNDNGLLNNAISADREHPGIASNKNSLAETYRSYNELNNSNEEVYIPGQPCEAEQVPAKLYSEPLRLGKNNICHEWADFGTGDYRPPSFKLRHCKNGSTVTQLTYASHKIYRGKPDFDLSPDFPRVRPLGKPGVEKEKKKQIDDCTTLVITLEDRRGKVSMDLVYTVFINEDAITRRSVVHNLHPEGLRTNRIYIEKLMSVTVDFHVRSSNFWATQLSGSWGRERHIIHTRLREGTHVIESTRGTSSHQHNPFAAISNGFTEPQEENGEVFGFSLLYSGSFLCEVNISEMGRLRFNMGLNTETFRWNLKPQKSFHSPECLMVYSAAGLGEMSHKFHDIVRNRIIPERFRAEPCPILLNSWEASYFEVNHNKIISLSSAATKLGIEMIVLDDGWFNKRNDATSSLGDWKADRDKFPFGIRGVAHQVEDEGLKFGIWIEPEMVSIDSDLYRAHPDWCLHVPGREMHLGRNQLVLDLTRTDVLEGVYALVKDLIKSSKYISYIKWDMNRHLTEVYSVALPPEEQGEVGHRYVMALYSMHRRLSTDFPDIRIEGCSGGGGRFDLGLLYFVPQIWCSDNTDALARLRIQHGTSLLYPAQCVGSHYSIVPNHVTQLWTRSRTRAFVAMCGTFGYELDPNLISERESDCIMQHTQVFRDIRHIIHEGKLYRLWSPFNTGFCSWLYSKDDHSANLQEVVVFIFNNTDNFWSSLVPRLRLRGLKPDAKYKILEPVPNSLTRVPANLQVVRVKEPVYLMGEKVAYMHGSTLMNAGIPVQFLTRDDCFLLHLVEVGS